MDNPASDDEIARFSNFLTEGKTIPKAPALAQNEQKEVASSVKTESQVTVDPTDLSFENSNEPLENLTKEVN